MLRFIVILYLVYYASYLRHCACTDYIPTLTRAGHVERTSDRKRALFEKVTNDIKLQVDDAMIIEKKSNMNLEDCFFLCLETPGCKSANYKWSINNCEILSVDRNDAPDTAMFVDGNNWRYFDTGFDLLAPSWRQKSLLKLDCSDCNSGNCGCYIEPGNNKRHCDCWSASGQVRYDGVWCIRSDTSQCSSPAGMGVEITRDCSGLETEMVFNPETSQLFSKCQNLILCANSRTEGEYVRVENTCSQATTYNRWEIGIFGEIMYGGFCVMPEVVAEGRLLQLKKCNDKTLHYEFPTKVEGRVHVEVFEGCTAGHDDCWGNRMTNLQPNYVRNLFNFEIPFYDYSMSYTGFRIKSYFVSPQSGPHTFLISANEHGRLYFGASEDSNSIIYDALTKTAHDTFTNSEGQTLVAGMKYYLEARLLETSLGYLWLRVGVQMPDGSQVKPITQKYLIAYP